MEKEKVYYVEAKSPLQQDGTATYSAALVPPETAKKLMQLDQEIASLNKKEHDKTKDLLFGARRMANPVEVKQHEDRVSQLATKTKERETLLKNQPHASFTNPANNYNVGSVAIKKDIEALPSFQPEQKKKQLATN